jgi:hypothetical protein
VLFRSLEIFRIVKERVPFEPSADVPFSESDKGAFSKDSAIFVKQGKSASNRA